MKSEIHIPNSDTIRVLLIEDNPGDSRLIREMVVDAGDSFVQLECADRLGTGLERLAAGDIDGLLLDLSLPDSQGLETFSTAYARAPGVATIVLTGLDDEELAVKAVRAGAQDYLVKGQVDGNLLVRSLRYAIERKRIHDELETANKLKTEFLSIMSHELRTPLGIIMMYTGMVQDRMIGEINEQQEKALKEVLNQSEELLSMIKNILEATKFEAGRVKVDLEWMSPVSFLNDLRTAYGFSLGKELTLKWDYPSNLPLFQSDCEKLKQILHNFINNSLKFTEKGRITVSARYHENQKTRTFGGMGLGLYIVKKFTDVLGGEVQVRSQPGQGSTFSVTLPVGKELNHPD